MKNRRLNLKIFKICVVCMRRVSAILISFLPVRSVQKNFKFYKTLTAKFHSWRKKYGAKPELRERAVNFDATNSRGCFGWFLKFQRRGADLLYLTPKKFVLKFDRFGSSRAKFYPANLTSRRK
ncbi:hypothetical protein CGRAC_0332 [Campylobacter gracilis]|uniref:Uncharacterized protein n=1 Tax=Campylobacter gracilis RM3268 TaxID=553220 RepID=C8PF24_9BACT|nr:hypothetical protein CGRAC_0332 [Campylobacter gracilis]EEV18652.1 hypothetical protein CAMGR0001_2665 [Campylobacter gracilis RM3268]